MAQQILKLVGSDTKIFSISTNSWLPADELIGSMVIVLDEDLFHEEIYFKFIDNVPPLSDNVFKTHRKNLNLV